MLNNGIKAAQGQPDNAQFNRVRDQSVVDQPRALQTGVATWSAVQSPVGPILPPWGTRQREWALRLWDRHEYNTLWQGAVGGLTKRWCSTPWTITGGKILANKYQRVFRGALSGEWVGWDTWLASLGREYLRQDGGAWIEVIGKGDPRGELTEVTGLGVLPSYNVWPTGDPEYPCVYWSRLGKYNLMHRSRVIHLIDMPDADNLNPGYGLCALSRAIAVVERQMHEQRYISISLNDVPSSGVVIAENVTPEQVQQAYNAMQERTQTDTPGQPGKVLWIHALNPAFPADLRNFTFSRPPDKFDWNTYVQIDVDMMALAIGVDRQDLWPLNTRSMGSGAQSEILAEKARGKMYGNFLTLLERELNSILPESLEFQFKTSDPQQAANDASTFKMWSDALISAGERMSVDEGRRLLAEQNEAVESVVTDEAGEMVELPDIDVRPVDGAQISPNSNPALPPTTQQAPVTATSSTPNAPSGTAAAQKGLETDEQRRWFFAHLSLTSPVPSEPVVMDFEEFANRRGASRQDIFMDSALHRSSSNVSGSARRSQLAIEQARNDAAFAKRDELRTEYDQHVAAGKLRPPTHDEILIRRAQGHDENPGVQAARRVLEKRGISWNGKAYKDIQSTRLDFEGDFNDLVESARNEDVNRRRFGIIARDLVRKYGDLAFRDGLKDGGVETDLDAADKAQYASILAQQTAYVANLGDVLFKGNGVSDAQAQGKGELWFNKSIQPFYQAGLVSADNNGMYEWQLGRTEKHCTTCLKMNGQKHRLKAYVSKGILPQSDVLDCGGWNCDCKLKKTSGYAEGEWA